MKREQVEIGLVRSLPEPQIESFVLYEDQLVLVVHPTHPFASAKSVRLQQLAAEQFILFDRESSYHELTSALFRESGVTPRGVMELDNVDATGSRLRFLLSNEAANPRFQPSQATDGTPPAVVATPGLAAAAGSGSRVGSTALSRG